MGASEPPKCLTARVWGEHDWEEKMMKVLLNRLHEKSSGELP